MISEQAKHGFDHIFKKAVMANLMSSDDSCDIQPINGLEEFDEDEFAVLTISSISFRFLTIFHLSSCESAQNYFTARSVASSKEIVVSEYRDAFLEFCNVCCGTMNREFLKYYPYLGMSTPYVLLKASTDFISVLNPGYVNHFRIVINDSVVLHATLCICNFGCVDFKEDASIIEEDTGELELF